MKLIARAPLENVEGRDRRPGDVFDVVDAEIGADLVECGACEPADAPSAAAEVEVVAKRVKRKA